MRTVRARALATFLSLSMFVACLHGGAALAQAPATPPDIVRTKDGGLVRGTIIELQPGKQVTLLALDGKTRTIPMSDVVFAGPAAQDHGTATPAPAAPQPSGAPAATAPSAPPAAAQAPAVAPAPRRLRFLADESNLTYFVAAGTAEGVTVGMNPVSHTPMPVAVSSTTFNRICTAPCEAAMDPGSYTLAIQRPDGGLLAADALTLRGDEELKATWVSRTGARWATFLAGAALLTIGIVVGAHTTSSCTNVPIGTTDAWGQPVLDHECTTRYPNEVPGLIMFGIGTGLLFAPLAIPDKAVIVPTGRTTGG
jgi:hypothetical protein